MEYEVRFYYSKNEYEKIVDRLKTIKELHSNLKLYEKTIQYNHCDSKYDFYTKDVNGRLRLRISRNELINKCKLSWKQRLSDATKSDVNKELEKEARIKPEDVDNLIYIIENVMHFEVAENYERYRTIFENNDIKVAVDEYPFGIALEVESKSTAKSPDEVIEYWVKKIGLNIKDAYRLSWDDKYKELCQLQGIEMHKEVTFDKIMPEINDLFTYNDK